jgi:hypothetical protein
MKLGVNTRRQAEIELRRWLRQYHGVIGRDEALRLGATTPMIRTKLGRGEWAPMHRGVYRDSATPTGARQDLRAAYVATGGRGLASHASAAWMWCLLRQPPDVLEISVSTSAPGGHNFRGIRIHRSLDLSVAAAGQRDGIPVTNPLRTLVDLAATALPEQLTEAVDSALARRLVTISGLEAEMARLSRPGRPGVTVLRGHLLTRGFVGAPEPSVLEARMRRIVVATGLPLPDIERRAGPEGEYRLDLSWPAVLFAVEVDGYVWHFTPEHKARDEARRNQLQQLGWTLLVYSWRDVVREPGRVAREITATHRRLSQP